MEQHVNVTVDFENYKGSILDLRVPYHQTVKKLIVDLFLCLKMELALQRVQIYAIRVKNKDLVLTDNDSLEQHKVGNGSILEIL